MQPGHRSHSRDRGPGRTLGARCVRGCEAAQRTRDGRDQIAHLELVNAADFARFKELGVIANFSCSGPNAILHHQATLPYLGPERSRYLYPARSLRDAGALIVGGSDWCQHLQSV